MSGAREQLWPPKPSGDLAEPEPIGYGPGPAGWYAPCERCGIAGGHDYAAGERAWTYRLAVLWARHHNRTEHR